MSFCNILICKCMQKHIQHNKDKRTQFFRKIYLSLYWKGSKGLRKVLSVRGELKTEQNYNILTPLFWPQQHFFLFSWAAQPGAWEPSLSWDIVLITASSLQLTWTSCHRGYIIIWHPPTSCERHICTQFNPQTVKVIPWSPDIFERMHLLFTQVHFSSDSPARSEVNMLQFVCTQFKFKQLYLTDTYNPIRCCH